MDTLGKLLSTREAKAIASCNSYASLVFSNLRAASSLRRRMHANRELIVKKQVADNHCTAKTLTDQTIYAIECEYVSV